MVGKKGFFNFKKIKYYILWYRKFGETFQNFLGWKICQILDITNVDKRTCV
jgi:hypothetical protein